MRLPRRVPWASIGELDQVCSWIFVDDLGTQGKVLAVNRLSAWKSITTLPHSLESTLALLTAILQDDLTQSPALSLRQSYATAIIRMVNGLVDPLQAGAYARSIASIAAQLGLPPWLVELRHAATHEDLPSLELLRDAARESMAWLFHNYFLPTLTPSTVSQSKATQLRPLTPILKHYKNLLKITTRDASVVAQYKGDIHSVQRDVERWISEAKVAAAVGELGWDNGPANDSFGSGDEDPKERWALDRFCDRLLEKGALVPLSKKKRSFPVDSFSPPMSSVTLWAPLLDHIRSNHPTFPFALVQRIIAFLFTEFPSPDAHSDEFSHRDISFDMCIARWAFWIVNYWDIDEEFEIDFKRDVTVTLVNALGPGSTGTARDKRAVTALLQAVCAGNKALEEAIKILQSSTSIQPSHDWNENDTAEMDERLSTLLSLKLHEGESSVEVQESPLQQSRILEPTSQVGLVRGWRLLDEKTGWRACPIGVHVDCSVTS